MHDAAVDIAAAARDFCDLIAHVSQYERDALVREAEQRLSALIEAAAQLAPVLLQEGPVDVLVPQVSDQEWFDRLRAIQVVLSEWDQYWTVRPGPGAAGHDVAPTPTLGSLSDDLADTWRDLVAGLRWTDNGGDMALAQWEWRFGFYSHWGTHATDALRVLHRCVANLEIPRA